MAGEIQAVAQVGLSILSGAASRSLQRARNKVADAEAAAANTVRQGRNLERAAQGSLARFMQSENNKRRLAAAGEQFNAGQMTLARMRDANAAGSIEDQIAAAEAAGAYAANSAFSGTGGASVDIIDTTMRLRNARQQQVTRKRQGYATYDTLQQIAGIMPQAAEGLDLTDFADGIDYSINLSQAQPVQGNFLLDVLKGVAGNPSAFSGGSTAPAKQPDPGFATIAPERGPTMFSQGQQAPYEAPEFFSQSSSFRLK